MRSARSRRARRVVSIPCLIVGFTLFGLAPGAVSPALSQDAARTADRDAALKLLADARTSGPDERLAAAEAAIARDKTCAVAFLERARARLAVGRKGGNAAYARARAAAPEDLGEALHLDPKLLVASWELANLAAMSREGREKQRRGYLETIRAGDADGWLGALAAGCLAAIDCDDRGAVEQLGKAIERNAADPLPYLERARVELLAGDSGRALADAEQAVAKGTGKSAEALVLRALARRAGRAEVLAVLADLDQAIQADPSWPAAYGLRALVKCDARVTGWEADADKALAIDDHEAFALLARAETLGLEEPSFRSRAGKDAAKRRQARDLLDQCLERDDTLVPALIVHATLAIRDLAYDEAFRDCDRTLQLEPANALAFALRGITFQRQGELEKAKIQLDKAIELDATLHLALVARAELLITAKPPSVDDAIRDLDRALHLEPDLPEAYYFRGRAKYNSRTRRNRFPEAVADLTMAIRTCDDDAGWLPTAYLIRALSHQQLKSYREAIDDFDEAERLAGPRPAGNSDLATLRKQRAKAKEDLEKLEKGEAKPDEKKPDEPKSDEKKPEDRKPD